jgi:glycosyltransferase involved in cell wall biosynthesis
MCEKYLSPRKKEAKPFVIYNGIDKDWCGEFVEHEGTNIIVTAKWRRHKRLQETIQLFLKHYKKYPHTHLHIFGLLHQNVPVKHQNIHYYGHVDRKDFMGHHAMADFTIHLSKKDACPNSVVEAIGAGIPVITTNACGGSTEMCAMTGGCIICDGDENTIEPCKPYTDAYNVMPPVLEENLLGAMETIEKDKYCVELPKELTAEYVAEKYFEVFKSIK